MKTCSRCEDSKPLEDFAWRNKKKGTRSSWCKECFRVGYKERYGEAERERLRVKRQTQRVVNREKMLEYLREHPCVDCGIEDIRVLQFDHKEMVNQGRRVVHYLQQSWARTLAEIEKCDVRCANCHMIRTAEQMGWSR